MVIHGQPARRFKMLMLMKSIGETSRYHPQQSSPSAIHRNSELFSYRKSLYDSL
jgi:hypothetical protein